MIEQVKDESSVSVSNEYITPQSPDDEIDIDQNEIIIPKMEDLEGQTIERQELQDTLNDDTNDQNEDEEEHEHEDEDEKQK